MKHTRNKYLLLFLLLVFHIYTGYSQDFYRFKADFTIKSKSPDNVQHLTIGTVYFDKNIKKIIFDVRFPQKETWVQKDSTIYKIIDNVVVDKNKSIDIAEFTIYNMALNGKLNNYGLKNSIFKLDKVEKEGENVILTWLPPSKYKEMMGEIKMLKNKQHVTGIVFLDNQGNIVSRQFFRKYENVDGLDFPAEIIVEKVVNGEKFYEITTYENIEVNDYQNDGKYDIQIP